MVIDDLRALPTSPLIVAEGSPLPLSIVSSGSAARARAVWLLPTAAFQEAQFAARGTAAGPAALYRLLRQLAERDVREHDMRTLTVDGSRPVSEIARAVEGLFRGAVLAGPRADTLDERRQLLRHMNQAIVAQVLGYHARPWAAGDPELVESLFVCECGQPGCEADLLATVGEASAGALLLASHS
jgi:hypothetical protein